MNIPTPSPEDPAKPALLLAVGRDLLYGCHQGALATLAEDGNPHAALVLTTPDATGNPLLLLSQLAEHSKHLARHPQAALLLDGTTRQAERLSGPRLTLRGTVVPCPAAERAGAKERFLRIHPEAKTYVGFADFNFFSFQIEKAYLVAGFGQIGWLDPRALTAPHQGG